jgi:hypothetical protein
MPSPRRFPAPWSAELQPNYYVVREQTGQLCALALIVTMVVMIVGMMMVAIMVMMVTVAIEIGVNPRWWISSPSGWSILSHGKRSSAHQQGRR